MRPLAILATVLTCATANAAGAQSLAYSAMTGFTPLSTRIQPTARSREVETLALLNGAAFAPATPATSVDPISRLIERETFAPGQGLVRWMSGETQLSPAASGGPLDSLRVRIGGVLRAP